MASLLYGKFQLFHRNFSLMEKLQNETAMYTRLVYIDTVGHAIHTIVFRFFVGVLERRALHILLLKSFIVTFGRSKEV
jgi:hypothetical protein